MKKISLLIILSIVWATAFGQLSKDNQKKLKKLNKKYEFVSIDKYQFDSDFKCENIFVGDYIYGANDGGGAPREAVKNVKMITIEDKVVKEISDFIILMPEWNNHENYKHLIQIESTTNGLTGLMTSCGEIILQPKYNHINGFSKDGYAIAFSGKNIDVIDAKGNSVLKQKLYLDFEYQRSRTFPLSNDAYKLQVTNGNLAAKEEANGNYGIYNVEQGKFITPLKYSAIDVTPLIVKNKVYYKVKYDDKCTLYSTETNTEIIPNVFFDIKDLYEAYDKTYVRGTTRGDGSYSTNLYDIDNRSFVVPDDVLAYELRPLNNKLQLWVIQGAVDQKQNSSGYGIYDVGAKKYLIPPVENNAYIENLYLFNTLKIKNKNTDFADFYSLDKRALLDLEISNKKLGGGMYPQSIKLKNKEGKDEVFFAIFLVQPNRDFTGAYHVIYDRNWNEIFRGIINNDKIVGNMLTFDAVEERDGLRFNHPMKIDTEGNLVR